MLLVTTDMILAHQGWVILQQLAADSTSCQQSRACWHGTVRL